MVHREMKPWPSVEIEALNSAWVVNGASQRKKYLNTWGFTRREEGVNMGAPWKVEESWRDRTGT